MSNSTNVKNPPNLLPRITQELVASLGDNERELLNLIGVSEFLCCLSVLSRERVAGRTSVPQKQADQVISLINSMGLHCHRSMFDLLPQSDLIGGSINHHCTYVHQGSQEGARAMLYFGIDPEFARGAETTELTKKQPLVGRLFGYPECCVEFFINNDGFNQDRTPYSVRDVGPFPSILNPIVAELYGISGFAPKVAFEPKVGRLNQKSNKRSNSETTFSMVKAKFGGHIRSKSDTAQVNEALCKVLCHNLCCVIQSMFEFGIEPNFQTASIN